MAHGSLSGSCSPAARTCGVLFKVNLALLAVLAAGLSGTEPGTLAGSAVDPLASDDACSGPEVGACALHALQLPSGRATQRGGAPQQHSAAAAPSSAAKPLQPAWSPPPEPASVHVQPPGVAPWQEAYPPQPSAKPRIAIVMNNDPEFVASIDEERGKIIISSWECYCLLHGYQCIFEPARVGALGTSKLGSWHHIARYRIRTVLKYLPFFDYVIQVALDTVIVDRSFGFEQFLEGSPDVVLSLRSNMMGGYHPPGTEFFPQERFPLRPDPMPHPPLLHTEVIIVKNSAHGVDFCNDLLKYVDIVPDGGVDMASIQYSALKFVWPVTEEVATLLDFSRNMSMGLPAVLPGDGYYGYTGTWSRDDLRALTLLYYDVTTKVVQRQRDWVHKYHGHLRVLGEAEVVRDWWSGKLMLGGDFIVHTKHFFYNSALTVKDVQCLPVEDTGEANPNFVGLDGRRYASILQPELFGNAAESVNVATAYHYNLGRVFGKVPGVL